MKIGTNNFINFAAALRYYTPQGYDEQDIQRAIDDESIVIGKPELEDDEYLTTVDGRYFINT